MDYLTGEITFQECMFGAAQLDEDGLIENLLIFNILFVLSEKKGGSNTEKGSEREKHGIEINTRRLHPSPFS